MRLKLLLLSFIIFLPCLVLAQDYIAIEVIGFVKDGTKNLKGATITLSSKSKKADTVIVTLDGKFTLYLEFDKDYTIEMSMPGFVSKMIEFSTKDVPEKEKKKAHGFEFEISLFKEMDEFQTSIFEKAVAKVIFNEKKGYFDYDDDYTQQQQLKFFKSFQKQIKSMKQELARETLKRDSLIKGIDRYKATAKLKAQRIIDSAMQKADSILIVAKMSSSISSMISLYDTIDKREEADGTKAKRKKDIEKKSNEPEVENIILSEFESKSMEDINSMLADTNKLRKREKEILHAKKLLEEDKRMASTKPDSLLISEREARINAEEVKVLLVKQMTNNARVLENVKNQKPEPTSQAPMASLALLFLLVSLFLLYKNRQLKQKTPPTS